MKKYKLTLLKDLPRFKAGTEVLNISQEELDGTKDYKYRHRVIDEDNKYEIYDLRDNEEWVKVEEDTRCDCETESFIRIRYEEIRGTCLNVTLEFDKKNIHTWCSPPYDETGKSVNLPIRFCPLCGKSLNNTQEGKDGGDAE